MEGTEGAVQETMRGSGLKRLWLVLSLLGITVSQVATATSRVDESATWVVRHCGDVREAIFEWPEDVHIAHAQGHRVVEIRISGEFVPDIQILLYKKEASASSNVVTVADGGVCRQLQRLKQIKPQLTVMEAIPLIERSRETGTASANHALRSSLDALQEMRLTPWPRATLYQPSRTTSVKVSGMLEEIEVTFQEAEPLAERVAYTGEAPGCSQPALAEWVHRIVETLEMPTLRVSKRKEEPHTP